MREGIEIRKQIESLIREYFAGVNSEQEFVPGKSRIPLTVPSYDWQEVMGALDSLLTTQVTMGRKVREFESAFARYIGVRHGIMVNSGSSANLLAMSILTNPTVQKRIRPGDEIVTPAVTWATTVWPIINCGAVPVLVDVDLDTFNMDVDEIKKAITDKTRAIMPVHLLGNPCDMDRIMKIAAEHDLYVIEDACEAHGAMLNDQKVGSFGDMSTFSFFFSHHLSTVEGGMLLTDNDEFAALAKSLRVFGWVRDLDNKDELAKLHGDSDPRYLFVNIGYNIRPTEMQAAFGIHQLPKLEKFIEIRRNNAEFWTMKLSQYQDCLLLHNEREGTRHVWFACPVTVRPEAPFSRRDLVDFLEARNVETRPIMSGNIAEQPGIKMFPYRQVGDLPNSKLIMRNSFFFGNHHGIGEDEREAVVEYIGEFMSQRIGK